MRLVCLHADTVDALKRLRIQFDDLTPNGLWSSQYHLVGLTADQMDALDAFQVQAEDVTPAQLAQAAGQAREDRRPAGAHAPGAQAGARAAANPPQAGRSPEAGRSAAGGEGGGRPGPAGEPIGREPERVGAGTESEVPLTQARDGGGRGGEDKAETRADAKSAAQGTPSQPAGGPSAAQKNAGAKGAVPVTPPAQAGRKGQPTGPGQGGQRYGTTRLRISVAGKYTEATVANGKIVVGGRTFDTPDQAAAELTKSRGDWTFWEYYDSADGKWRMLTRDWDTVLKSAAPGGR
jgi:hypothetical protein